MAWLPEDVLIDILVCLPVKPLLRFRCVSKHFLTLIEGPHFIKQHLNRSVLTKTNHKLILHENKIRSPIRFYSVDLNKPDQTIEFDHPCGKRIIGSVNGLLCLYRGIYGIYICNFATRRYWRLPVVKIDFDEKPYHLASLFSNIVYGFGYDSVSDDYKLLRLVVDDNDIPSFHSKAKVYSMRSNSSQTIQHFPYYFHYGKGNGQLASGALRWVVSRKHQTTKLINPFDPAMYEYRIIAAFDLARNEYRVVDYPEFLEKGPCQLTELEGNLCMTCFYIVRIDVWMMKDYGVKESWSKLFSVSQPEVISSCKSVIPLTYSKSRTEIMLLQDSEKLLWYSLKEKTLRTIYLRGCPHRILSQVCVESLVPVSGQAEDHA